MIWIVVSLCGTIAYLIVGSTYGARSAVQHKERSIKRFPTLSRTDSFVREMHLEARILFLFVTMFWVPLAVWSLLMRSVDKCIPMCESEYQEAIRKRDAQIARLERELSQS